MDLLRKALLIFCIIWTIALITLIIIFQQNIDIYLISIIMMILNIIMVYIADKHI